MADSRGSRRRATGDGSVYQDRPRPGLTEAPRWRGSVVVGWREKDGRQIPVRKYVTAKTERDAARKVRDLIRDRDTGRTVWTAVPRAADYARAWLDAAEPDLAPNTSAGYRTAIRRFETRFGTRIRLDAITRADLEHWYTAMLTDGLSVRTVHHQHATVRRMFNVAVRQGVLQAAPTDRVELPTKRRHPSTPPPPEDVLKALDAAAARGESARWLLSLLLGLRQGEVLGLPWECVDFTGGSIRVAYSLTRKRGAGLALKETKADRVRTLPLPGVLRDALLEHRRRQVAARLAAGASWRGWVASVGGVVRPVDLVFTTRVGSPVSREDDWRAWHALLVAAGLPRTRLHDARVAAGTLLAWAGVHPRVAMEILGHSDISVTMSVYTNVPTEVARDAVSAVETFLSGRRVARGSS